MDTVILVLLLLITVWWFLRQKRTRQLQAIEDKRLRFAQQQPDRPGTGNSEKVTEIDARQFELLNRAWERELEAQSTGDYSFSLKSLLVALTVVAIFLGCVQTLEGSTLVVLILWATAAGTIADISDVELHPLLKVVWWLILGFYALVMLYIGGHIGFFLLSA